MSQKHKGQRLWERMLKTLRENNRSIKEMEVFISENSEFCTEGNFSIFYQESDGYVVEYETYNARLSSCLFLIEEHGVLKLDDYFKITI